MRIPTLTRLARPTLVTALILAVAPATDPAPLAAQVIEGRVLEPETDSPLTGVHLRLLDPDDRAAATAFSNDSGLFRIAAPAPGAWRLAAELLGYGTAVSDTIELAEDQRVRVEVRMAVEPVRIEDPIVVVGERRLAPDIEAFHRRRERGEMSGFGHFIDSEDVARHVGGPPTDLLRMIPGVRITGGRHGTDQIIRMRGGCVPAIFIDGSRINRFSPGESLDSYVSVSSIEGIEVYKGSHQPSGVHFDPSGCGLVLVWTRRGEFDSEGTFSWLRLALGLALVLGLFFLR